MILAFVITVMAVHALAALATADKLWSQPKGQRAHGWFSLALELAICAWAFGLVLTRPWS